MALSCLSQAYWKAPPGISQEHQETYMVVECTFGILKTHVWVGRAKAGEKNRQDPNEAQHEPKGKFHIVPIRPRTDMCLSLRNP